jgi:hypothetical protein
VARQAETIPVYFITLRGKTQRSDPSEYFGGSRRQIRSGTGSVSFSPIWGLGEIVESAPFYIPDEKIKLTEVQEIPLEHLLVESIDISGISTRRISGHLYHLFNPEVIRDLTMLLHSGEPANRRPSLQPSDQNGVPYWLMMPDS